MDSAKPIPARKSDDARKSAAKRLGLQVDGDQVSFSSQSLLNSLGGWLGIVESIIPTVAFGIAFSISQSVLISIAVSGGLSLIFIVRQLISKAPVSQAVAGLAVLGISAFFALRPGAENCDYFVWGLLTNVSYGAVMLVSVLVRWPIIGLLVGLLKDQSISWKKDKALVRRFNSVTLMWVGLFATRLSFELPIYFAPVCDAHALSIVKTILGVPLYAVVLWLTWLSLRSVISDKR